ncbi:MAG TPA: AarF/UbiB family protein [Propionibacteriaceae bacterium]|nr:AarF/UbiB family protein [Propionibacteriaceae bacterium]
MVTRHLERYREIAETLARHGLGVLLGASGMERWIPFNRRLVRYAHRGRAISTAEHLRLALEDLGPTFVKLGQVLSTRSDLLPPAYLTQLARLQDSLTPVPAPVIRETVEQELGASLEDIFTSFDLTPLASASIGQAHAATLTDGTEVVVKVRRPGTVEQVEEDLEILHNFAAQASRRWVEAKDYDLPGLADEFARTLRAELDYLAEARNAERFAENFAGNDLVHIPRVYWETTTSRVLTLERIRGVKVSDLVGLEASGIDRPALATRAAEVAGQMIFDDGFFHADPHPGNLFIEPDGRIGLIDFGMVGVVDAELRERLGVLLIAFARKDPHRIAVALSRVAQPAGEINMKALTGDMVPIIELYDGKPLGEAPIGRLIREMLSVLRRRHLQLPREISLLLKMVLMTEGMGVALDPDFQLSEVVGPYAQRLVANRYSAAAMMRHLGNAGVDALDLAGNLPIQLRRFQAMLDAGGPEVHLRAHELEPLVTRMETMVQRIVLGVVAAAAIRGVGDLVTATSERRGSWQAPLLGASVGTAGTAAAALAWSLRRKR